MSHERYDPGPAKGAQIQKDGDDWTLVVHRDLRHSPERVWAALTEPEQLHEWAPFDADRSLGRIGPATLSTAGTPTPQVSETEVTRADAPHLLEYRWGGGDLRWQLESSGEGTRLTLWHRIDRKFIAMGAAGWHVCFDVLDRLLDGDPMGRLVAGDALKSKGWQRLHEEYARQFGVEMPQW